jgi:hypothetical protein
MVSSVPFFVFAIYCDFFWGGLAVLGSCDFSDVAVFGGIEYTAFLRCCDCRPPPRFYWQVAMLLRSVGKLRFLIFVGRLVFVGKLCLDGWEA